MSEQYYSRVYTDRPAYADFDAIGTPPEEGDHAKNDP